MRLLRWLPDGELILTKNLTENIPSYAILSHTWGPDDEEVNFDDLKTKNWRNKAGYDKIRFCGQQARKDGLRYFWVDTCCIDKANHAELSEALISMFGWYRNAVKCYVYLSDVVSPIREDGTMRNDWKFDFTYSRWFSRGWTLQELLAPKIVEFFSREGQPLGDRTSLEQLIHQTTRIPLTALQGSLLSLFSIDERMRWAAKRQTKRKEDQAYCLFGIFGVYLPILYDEGDNAFIRLEEEIVKSLNREKPDTLAYISYISFLSLRSNISTTNTPLQALRMTVSTHQRESKTINQPVITRLSQQMQDSSRVTSYLRSPILRKD